MDLHLHQKNDHFILEQYCYLLTAIDCTYAGRLEYVLELITMYSLALTALDEVLNKLSGIFSVMQRGQGTS